MKEDRPTKQRANEELWRMTNSYNLWDAMHAQADARQSKYSQADAVKKEIRRKRIKTVIRVTAAIAIGAVISARLTGHLDNQSAMATLAMLFSVLVIND